MALNPPTILYPKAGSIIVTPAMLEAIPGAENASDPPQLTLAPITGALEPGALYTAFMTVVLDTGRSIASWTVVLDGAPITAVPTATGGDGYEVQFVLPSAGPHSLVVTVVDDAGGVGSDGETFTTAVAPTGDIVDDYLAIVNPKRLAGGLAAVTAPRVQDLRDYLDGLDSDPGLPGARSQYLMDLFVLGADYNVGHGTEVVSLYGRIGNLVGTTLPTWEKNGIRSGGGDAAIVFPDGLLHLCDPAFVAIQFAAVQQAAPSASQYVAAQWVSPVAGAIMVGADSTARWRAYGRGTSAEFSATRTTPLATVPSGVTLGRQGANTLSAKHHSPGTTGQTINSTATGVGSAIVPENAFVLLNRNSRSAGFDGLLGFVAVFDFWIQTELHTIYGIARSTFGKDAELNIPIPA